MNWKILAGGALVIAPLVAVLASGFGGTPQGVSNALEGREAADFALEDLRGRTHRLSEQSGRPVVLNFWASWCRPCVQEHPELAAAQARYSQRGVAFYGVLYGDEPEKAAAFLERHGGGWPALVDPGNRVAIDYGVTGVPETFVIDGEGRIVKKFNGPVRLDELTEVLEEVL